MVGLSEDDLEQIQSFANTPRYRRSPSSLVPEEEREDEPDAERADTETGHR